MRLVPEKIKIITGKIKCVTGLLIGGSDEKIEIGGLDKTVIKDKQGFPYIPGSSVKGKMRSLLEWATGKVENGGETHSCAEAENDCPICRIFGTTKKGAQYGPTRLIVRDAYLSASSRGKMEELRGEGELIYEEKSENTINRLNAHATPRHFERVPPGTEFDFEMVYRVFYIDNDKGNTDETYFKYVINGLYLLQNYDALGGSISRGYGKIEFIDPEVKVNEKKSSLELKYVEKIIENIQGHS